MKQEVFILSEWSQPGADKILTNQPELNKRLQEDWQVVSVTPMGVAGPNYVAAAVLVLQRAY